MSEWKRYRLGRTDSGSINEQNFENIKIVIPNKCVTLQFEKLVNAMDDKILQNVLQIRTLTQVRDSLLPKLMSGKIEVKKFIYFCKKYGYGI
ncbi:MAG: hypothetical protein LBT50_09545 [Prevotellaceae bacterium]|jgi:type I restriction enzyme S subunit|nr:hypothetical protein [Prevotellaceae bacterium]